MNTPATKPKSDEIRAAIFSFKHAFFTVALFSMFLNVLALSPSIYMLQVYDRVLVSRNETTLLMLIAADRRGLHADGRARDGPHLRADAGGGAARRST